jgi:hypothetical protein
LMRKSMGKFVCCCESVREKFSGHISVKCVHVFEQGRFVASNSHFGPTIFSQMFCIAILYYGRVSSRPSHLAPSLSSEMNYGWETVSNGKRRYATAAGILPRNICVDFLQ